MNEVQPDLADVARRFYIHEQSKVRIAQDLGITRFAVARMLQQARDEGIVTIRIAGDVREHPLIATKVAASLGIDEVFVVDLAGAQDAASHRRLIGAAAAQQVGRVLRSGDVLGLPWSRMVSTMVEALPSLPPVEVVQLSGVLTLPEPHSALVDVVRTAGARSGGRAHHFYAPFVATDAESAAAMRRQPQLAATLAWIDRVTVAAVGIGAWSAGESTIFGLATPKERKELAHSNIVGEVSGVLIDADGNAADGSLSDRIISLNYAQLQSIPQVFGLALGASRASVVRAAVRGGLVSSLVVDLALAEALLALETGTESTSSRR